MSNSPGRSGTRGQVGGAGGSQRGGFGVRGGIDHDKARAGASGGGKGSIEAGGGNGAHERGAPPPVAPEGGAGLGVEVDQGGRAASALEIGGHVDGQGGLAGAALLG